MLFSDNKSLEDLVIELLLGQEITVKNLYRQVLEKHDESVTIQAVYKVINQLIDAGVVLKVGKIITISREWTDTVARQFNQQTLPLITEGESITYNFRSFSHLDAYWKTLTMQLLHLDDQFPVFFYVPHDFWILIPDRQASEERYYESFNQKQAYAYYLIGGETTADKAFKKQYTTEYMRIDLDSKANFKRTRHYTVIENFIVTTELTSGSAEIIDNLYKNCHSLQELETKLQPIFNRDQRLRIKLEHKADKARKLRKKISRNFYVPADLVEKYDLF